MTDKYIPARLRRLVRARAAECCEYCRVPESFCPQSLAIDHIFPHVLGGKTRADNLACCCQGCNSRKLARISSLDPVTSQTVQFFHPRRQRWRDHFTWNDDFTEIVGLTPIGRATVAALDLNRRGLLNLRRALHAYGAHPPSINEEGNE
jgi:hypothetical protein